jgi:hypothetical protein
MKALKHMEAIFVIAAALATATSFATATTPVLHVAADQHPDRGGRRQAPDRG